MKITDQMLQALVALNTVADTLGADAVKPLKKQWWTSVRETYNLDADTKYKVATTGDMAGELRFKATGEAVPDNQGKFIVVCLSDYNRYTTVEAANAAKTDHFDVVAQIAA